ncbi:MAG TPA: histidine phosphatase family protein, partial [Candidatus Methylomirabilis sp.]
GRLRHPAEPLGGGPGGGAAHGGRLPGARVPIGRVLSSRWCRCLETARLAFGEAEPWGALDSFFDDRGRGPLQTQAVRARAGARPAAGNLILVTHHVNILALTGIAPLPGEIIVLVPQGDGTFRAGGRLTPASLDAP